MAQKIYVRTRHLGDILRECQPADDNEAIAMYVNSEMELHSSRLVSMSEGHYGMRFVFELEDPVDLAIQEKEAMALLPENANSDTSRADFNALKVDRADDAVVGIALDEVAQEAQEAGQNAAEPGDHVPVPHGHKGRSRR